MLVLITPPITTPDELHLVSRLLEAGLPTLHVRKPGCTREAMTQYLQGVPRKFHNRLVVHQHHDLAGSALRGVHYPQSEIPDIMEPPLGQATASVSLHALQDLTQCRRGADYCFLAPIYHSISKRGHGPPGELADRQRLSSAVLAARLPVLALGGVTAANFEELAEWGFSGAALLGAIWGAPDPVAALTEALEKCDATAWNESGASCPTGFN